MFEVILQNCSGATSILLSIYEVETSALAQSSLEEPAENLVNSGSRGRNVEVFILISLVPTSVSSCPLRTPNRLVFICLEFTLNSLCSNFVPEAYFHGDIQRFIKFRCNDS